MDKGKSDQFGHIWAHFLGLRKAPMGLNVWYSPPGHQLGRWTWYRHSLGDFRLGWPLTILFECGQRQIWLVWAYLGSFFGREGGPYGHKCVVWSTWTLTRRRTWYRHSLEGLRLGWPLTMPIERGQRQICLVWAYLGSFLGLRVAPMATNVWYGPLGHWQGRWTSYSHSLEDLRLG